MLRLTEDDLKRIDKSGVKELIKANEKMLKNPYISRFDREDIENEIKELEKLL